MPLFGYVEYESHQFFLLILWIIFNSLRFLVHPVSPCSFIFCGHWLTPLSKNFFFILNRHQRSNKT